MLLENSMKNDILNPKFYGTSGFKKTVFFQTNDAYFLESNDKIRFFFEADAFDKETGDLQMPKHTSLNKVRTNQMLDARKESTQMIPCRSDITFTIWSPTSRK